MFETIDISTSKREEFINITRHIRETVTRHGIENGTVTIYVPHTTAGLTVNENADPDVIRDMLFALDRAVPDSDFHHIEGNSTAHIKSSLFGVSQVFIINEGKIVLGTWQSIYFCEFDGPRQRKLHVQTSSHK